MAPDSAAMRPAGRTLVMGVLNVTPDSFSGDGIYLNPALAAFRATIMVAEGADIIDVGGESTRPGSRPITLEEELNRVLPAVRRLVRAVAIPISVDTSKAEVARRALAEGASMINDVSGLSDPETAAHVAAAGAAMVLVHNGKPPPGEDLLTHVIRDLGRQVALAEHAGIAPERILVDPGLGMGKGWRENFEIIRRLAEVCRLDKPVLVGPSRKGMISRVLGSDAGDRMEGSAALVALCLANGANAVRVHDVKQMARVARTMDAILARAQAPPVTSHLLPIERPAGEQVIGERRP